MGVSGFFSSSVSGISWVRLLENNSGFGFSVGWGFEVPPESSCVESWCFSVGLEILALSGEVGSSLMIGLPVAPR